jgi:hypothetical protein
MRPLRTLPLCAALLVAGSALWADDPWLPAASRGVELVMARVSSPREVYSILLADEPWEGADGPERAEPATTEGEREALAQSSHALAQGETDAALAGVDALLAEHASNWDAHVLRARVLHAQGSHADAAAALRTALIGNRRCPEAWELLDSVAKALGKKVVRPRVAMRGWVRDRGKAGYELGHVATDDDGMPWNYYAAARAHYRFEGPFARDFPKGTSYTLTFREQMYAVGVLAASAVEQRKDGVKLSADLRRVLSERTAGTLPPFAFFAVHPEPVPAQPEPGWDKLLPRLVKYFDQKILVRR